MDPNCPYCSTDPGCCCRTLAHLREKRRAIEKRKYWRDPDKYREKAKRHYAKRPTKPTGVSGPLPEPDPT